MPKTVPFCKDSDAPAVCMGKRQVLAMKGFSNFSNSQLPSTSLSADRRIKMHHNEKLFLQKNPQHDAEFLVRSGIVEYLFL